MERKIHRSRADAVRDEGIRFKRWRGWVEVYKEELVL
jgi:hypothetical protein